MRNITDVMARLNERFPPYKQLKSMIFLTVLLDSERGSRRRVGSEDGLHDREGGGGAGAKREAGAAESARDSGLPGRASDTP